MSNIYEGSHNQSFRKQAFTQPTLSSVTGRTLPSLSSVTGRTLPVTLEREGWGLPVTPVKLAIKSGNSLELS